MQLILAPGGSHCVASVALSIRLRERSISVYCVIIFTSNLLFDNLRAVQHFLNILYDFQFWYLVCFWLLSLPELTSIRFLQGKDSWLNFLLVLLNNFSCGDILIDWLLTNVRRNVLLLIRFFITINDTWSRAEGFIIVLQNTTLFVRVEIIDLLSIKAPLVFLAWQLMQVASTRGPRIVLILFYFCL